MAPFIFYTFIFVVYIDGSGLSKPHPKTKVTDRRLGSKTIFSKLGF